MTAVWNGSGQKDFEMKYYLAPLEGITGCIFRNTLREVFGDVDKCFTPFIAPNENRPMNMRERTDVLPEHNEGIFLVPQILTNRADHFLTTARELAEMGYEEINLNLGCPSGTVAAKKRGAGFLSEPEKLEAFLEEIYNKCPVQISIKTRLGIYEPEEFYEILEIYKKFPVSELIIHPRVQKDFYKNKPRMEVFRQAAARSTFPVCYNGDLFSVSDIEEFRKSFPDIDCAMIGRGALKNPAIFRMLQLCEENFEDRKISKRAPEDREMPKGAPDAEELRCFHDLLVERYYERMADDRNVLFKMKELWSYLIYSFKDAEKYGKKIRKAQKLADYREVVRQLFAECPVTVSKEVNWNA